MPPVPSLSVSQTHQRLTVNQKFAGAHVNKRTTGG